MFACRSACLLLVGLTLSVVGCASDDGASDDEGDDPATGSSSEAVTARWQPPSTHQIGTIEEGGPWSGGRSCAGALKSGSRSVGDALEAKFSAIAKVEGYACRPNTANRSQLSMHGTGRALDLFVSKAGGDAVANYLVKNANQLGVQLVIWKRTLWKVTPGGGSSRAYGGPNPHTDHIHAELTRAAASGQVAPPNDDSAEPAEPAPTDDVGGGGATCARDGDCNPGNDGSGTICQGGQCVPGCRIDAHCPGVTTCQGGQCM